MTSLSAFFQEQQRRVRASVQRGDRHPQTQRMTAVAQVLAAHPRVRDFRSTGMIWAFEVADTDATFGRRLFEAALARELLLRPIGGNAGNTVYFMPPYVISDAEMALLAARTQEALDATL